MLHVVCEWNGGDIRVEKALKMGSIEENLNGSIAAFLGESMFHFKIFSENDGIADDLETAEF